MEMNNYLLGKIAEIVAGAPEPRAIGSLADYQKRLDDMDERMDRIIAYANQLDQVLQGKPHTHVAGTLAGKHIDECAVCGHDIRSH